LDGSLGYYINPLFNVFLGRLFLQERYGRCKKTAVALAFTGVAILIISFGQVPWIALSLAVTFGIYGLLRKKSPSTHCPGLLLETMMMLPFALVYWVGFSSEMSNLGTNSLSLNITLICAGIVTTAPLLCFYCCRQKAALFHFRLFPIPWSQHHVYYGSMVV